MPYACVGLAVESRGTQGLPPPEPTPGALAFHICSPSAVWLSGKTARSFDLMSPRRTTYTSRPVASPNSRPNSSARASSSNHSCHLPS
jgi:hypothetical protein